MVRYMFHDVYCINITAQQKIDQDSHNRDFQNTEYF
jgi:hypothetical protein